MSQETSQWLNQYTLIGFTEKRGNAWHYRESDQGVEPNHYPGPVPVEDVLRRLFDWKPVRNDLYVRRGDGFQLVEGRQAIVRNDDGTVLGIFKDGYQPPDYAEWCITNVANILDDELGIGSAGLLRSGAQAWVQVEMPENIQTPEGVTFRPFLVACDSADGSLARTYKTGSQLVVCDNTLSAALSSKDGSTFKLKHTRYNDLRISDARQALNIVHSMADDFAAEVAKLCAEDVSPQRWVKVLDQLVPVPEDEGRGKTVALNKREKLIDLYTGDPRVAPWKDTAFGVLQAFNTYLHHEGTVRRVSRAERNMSNAVTGRTDAEDMKVLQALAATAS